MSIEENKAIVRRFIEELNKRNIAIMDELIAPEMVHPTLQVRGLEAYKQFDTMLWKAFPDWHETILDMVAEGDKVWGFLKLRRRTQANCVPSYHRLTGR
jgi:predicted ester cyclase